MLQIFLLVLGLILLIVFSNVFVDSSTSLANSFKIPKMVVALTIASFCTCAPELADSFSSLENYDVSIANVIGSCIANILLIFSFSIFSTAVPKKNNEKILKNAAAATAIATSSCLNETIPQ